MSSYPALAGLRIGCVKYLNSKPLIDAYPGPVEFDHPSQLARDLARGKLDAALVPIFEALRCPEYLLVDGVAIASEGPVYSVFLAYQGELSAVRKIRLDPASMTSVHLLKVVLAEFYSMKPEYVAAGDESAADAQLLIGNQAIEFRKSAAADVHYLDLGEEWKKQTGLPFVFALWVVTPHAPAASEIAEAFRRIKEEGKMRVEEIVGRETPEDQALARKYLTEYIRFDLGERHKQAIERFRGLLAKYGFLSAPLLPLQFI